MTFTHQYEPDLQSERFEVLWPDGCGGVRIVPDEVFKNMILGKHALEESVLADLAHEHTAYHERIDLRRRGLELLWAEQDAQERLPRREATSSPFRQRPPVGVYARCIDA